MKFQLVALIATIAQVQAKVGGKVPICKKIGEGEYKLDMVKAARVGYFTGDDADNVKGRCGPDNCADLCKDFKDFSVTGAGTKCTCLN